VGFVETLHHHRVSGAERVRAIERLAATRLGVRELSRRTGFAASTISRWLKIDRCAILKQALESEAVDIGRAKLLADAPESALADLIQVAPRLSRPALAQRVAALRARVPTVELDPISPNDLSSNSRRLRRALRLLESVSHLDPDDWPVLEQLNHGLNRLNTGITQACKLTQLKEER
jgi:hypothetical protein